mgnify:CR=1 FL=1
MSQSSLSDRKLVEAVRKGRPEMFGRLVERHQDRIYNSVYYMVSNREDAEDLAQEVFLKAYDNIHSFRQEAKFGTWLFGIMLNTVRSYWRKQSRRSSKLRLDHGEDGETIDVEAEVDGPVKSSLRAERVQQVREAIDRLKHDLREVIVLRDIEGMTYEEIAEALDVPMGTVKSRLYRARNSLKEKLIPVLGEDL